MACEVADLSSYSEEWNCANDKPRALTLFKTPRSQQNGKGSRAKGFVVLLAALTLRNLVKEEGREKVGKSSVSKMILVLTTNQ